VLVSFLSLHHTQCPISSAFASSFSALVYLPRPSSSVTSNPVPLARVPTLCSPCVSRCSIPIYIHPFVPISPTTLSSFIVSLLVILVLAFSHHSSPTAPVYFLLLATVTMTSFVSTPSSLSHSTPAPTPAPTYPSLLPFGFLSRRLHTPLWCGPSPHEPLHPRTAFG